MKYLSLLFALLTTTAALACPPRTDGPVGIINITPAMIVSGNDAGITGLPANGTPFNRDPNGGYGILNNVAGSKNWLQKSDSAGYTITKILGVAHHGDPSGGGYELTAIEIWGWRDYNGDGNADPKDLEPSSGTVTHWQLLSTPTIPTSIGASGIGWPMTSVGNALVNHACWPCTATSVGNVPLTSGGIHIGPGESWLLLIRVVSTASPPADDQSGSNPYDTNLTDDSHGELWGAGDGVNGNTTPNAQFFCHNGAGWFDKKHPEHNHPFRAGAACIDPSSIVWVYCPKPN